MAKEFITIDASAAEGVDFAAYLADYFAAMGTTTRGATTYYGSTFYEELVIPGGDGYYDGLQVGVRYAGSSNNAQVLMEGHDLQYDGVVGLHGYSGAVDKVSFGTWDANTQYLQANGERSSLIGVNKELVISGLGIFEEVGAGFDEDNAFYQLMTALRNANSTTIETGNTLTNGELAIQKLYQMFASKAQHFVGSEGDDTYVGTRFADKIDGGAGSDTLAGGKGKDLFIFDLDDSAATAEGADIILDFNANRKDRLDLSLIDIDLETPDNEAFKFIGTKDFTGKAGQVNYERVDGQTHVHLDTDGNSEADMTIILDGKFKLDVQDFLL